MTTWKDGGMYGQMKREIVSEDGSHPIATVRVRQYLADSGTEPWPQGEANFRLVLKAPQMLEALEAIVVLELGGCDPCKEIARAAIAAVKGEHDEDVKNHNNELA